MVHASIESGTSTYANNNMKGTVSYMKFYVSTRITMTRFYDPVNSVKAWTGFTHDK